MLKPCFDYIFVKRDDTKERSTGGIYIADTSKEKPSTGIVVAVGTGAYAKDTGKLIPMDVNVGDKVLFPRLIGIDTEWEGQKLIIMKSTDIMAKIEV